jgi:hypothetical protein
MSQIGTTHPSHGLPHPTGAHNIPSLSQRGTRHPTHGIPHPIGAHNIPSSSQRGTTHLSHGHTQLMDFLTPHRGIQRSIFFSDRNNKPISWAHPTHKLPHRLTHLVCVQEDVSRSCNHQQFTRMIGQESTATIS